MGLRGKMRALERLARGKLGSFELEDGSRHYFDRSSGELFLHSLACLRAQGEGKTTFPEPPETLRAICRAKDRRAALAQVYPAGAFDIFPYDTGALVERGELVPRSMVVGREMGEVLGGLLGVAEWRLADGFAKTLGQVAGRRLTYNELTGKD